MKKNLKLIFTLLLSCTFLTINVYAESVTVNETKDNDYGIKGSGSMRGFARYSATVNGETSNLYCRDAGLHMTAGTHNASVESLDPSNPHDAGIIYIINNGRTSLNNTDSRDNIVKTEAIRIFDYIFGLVSTEITKYKSDQVSCDSSGCKIINCENNCTVRKHGDFYYEAAPYYNLNDNAKIAVAYVDASSEIQNLIKEVPGASHPRDKYSSWLSGDPAHICNPLNSSGCQGQDSVQEDITKLLVGALTKAKEASEGNADSGSNSFAQEFDKDSVKADEGTNYKQMDTYSYVAKNYNVSSGTKDKILIKFDCADCSKYEIGYSIVISATNSGVAKSYNSEDSDAMSKLSNGLNLIDEGFLKETDAGSGISKEEHLTIKVVFTAPKDKYDCGNEIPYKMTIQYTGGSSGAKRYVFECDGSSGQACSWQVMYGVEAIDESTDTGYAPGTGDDDEKDLHEISEDGTIDFCDADCIELEKQCSATKNDQSNECKTYHDKCDKAQCNVYVSSAKCDISESELIIKEGTNGKSPCDKNSEVDVYTCVTKNGAADNLGREYKQTTMNANSAYTNTFKKSSVDVSNNRFCNVACIENYHITLPPVQNDNAGRYFQVSAEIKGNKSCYTSEIKKGDSNNPLKDPDTFEYMFEVDREKAIEYYNLYMFNTALNSAASSAPSTATPINQEVKYYVDSYPGSYNCEIWEANGWNLWYDPYYSQAPFGTYWGTDVYPSQGLQTVIPPILDLNSRLFYGDPQTICQGMYFKRTENTEYWQRDSLEVTFSYDTYSYDWSDRSNPANFKNVNIRLKNGTYDEDGNNITVTNTTKKRFFKVDCKQETNNKTKCTISSYGYFVDNVVGKENVKSVSAKPISEILKLENIYEDQSSKITSILKDIYPTSYNYTSFSDNISDANTKIQGRIDDMKLLTNELAQCTGWDMKFNFNPTLTFDYEEEYINGSGVNKQLLPVSSGSSTSSVESKYCNEKMTYDDDGNYSGCSNNLTNNPKYDKRNIILYKDGSSVSDLDFYVNDALTAYQTIPVSQEFVTPVQFRTLSPSGVIVLLPSTSTSVDEGLIIPGWPIEFAHQGVFTYKIQVDNLGEFNDGRLGRVWDKDEKNDVVRQAEADKASNPSCQSDESTIDDDGKYYCSYKVNCNDCPSYCDDSVGICYDPDPCPDCPSRCNPDEGACIVDGELNVSPRPVSPNNIKPNERPLGKNWAWDDTIDSYLELKAFVTTQEIQENGETIFEADFDANYTETNVFAINYGVKFHLTSDVINYIKNTYNRGRTYSDNSLECYPYKNNNTGETFNDMFCYSKFIDTLINEFGEDAVKIQGTRPLSTDERKNLTAHSWWTTWDQAEPSVNRWRNGPVTFSIDAKINTNLGTLHYSTDGNTQIGIGPAWK